jgi:hypothetical protein
MFCSECGTKAEGKFCWNCGQPLRGHPGTAARDTADEPVIPFEAVPRGDWSREVRYDVLGAHPAVRDLIARHGAQANKPLSGEAILKVIDKLSLSAVPLGTIAEISLPLWNRLGLKAAMKTRTETIARPCGHVIVAALC